MAEGTFPEGESNGKWRNCGGKVEKAAFLPAGGEVPLHTLKAAVKAISETQSSDSTPRRRSPDSCNAACACQLPASVCTASASMSDPSLAATSSACHQPGIHSPPRTENSSPKSMALPRKEGECNSRLQMPTISASFGAQPASFDFLLCYGSSKCRGVFNGYIKQLCIFAEKAWPELRIGEYCFCYGSSTFFTQVKDTLQY